MRSLKNPTIYRGSVNDTEKELREILPIREFDHEYEYSLGGKPLHLSECRLCKIEAAIPRIVAMVERCEQREKETMEILGNLAWAADVQINGPHPRSFIIQHKSKVRFWVKKAQEAEQAYEKAKGEANGK